MMCVMQSPIAILMEDLWKERFVLEFPHCHRPVEPDLHEVQYVQHLSIMLTRLNTMKLVSNCAHKPRL